jgi:hypothetical protein
MPRICIFCPNKADSKEHVISDWMLKILPEAKDGKFTIKLPDGSFKTLNIGKPLQKAGVVCERCNNNWMSTKLETPMKAATEKLILDKHSKIFSDPECDAISKWMFKALLVGNHMNRDDPEFFDQEARYSFAKDQTIPRGVHVWYGRRDAGHLTTTMRSVRRTQQRQQPIAPHLTTLPESPHRFEIYNSTFVIGWLLLQVTATRWTNPQKAGTLYPPTITQDQVFDEYAIPIWPPQRRLRAKWPPPKAIDTPTFEFFWDRWQTGFTIPEWMV